MQLHFENKKKTKLNILYFYFELKLLKSTNMSLFKIS